MSVASNEAPMLPVMQAADVDALFRAVALAHATQPCEEARAAVDEAAESEDLASGDEDAHSESAADDDDDAEEEGDTSVQIGFQPGNAKAAGSSLSGAATGTSAATAAPPRAPRFFGKQPRAIFRRPLKGGVRTTRRAKPGAAALREIKHLQSTCDLLIPSAPFEQLVRDACLVAAKGNRLRLEPAAIVALQVAAEEFLVETFKNANAAAIHANRVTVMPKDSRFVLKLTEPGIESQLDRAQEDMEKNSRRIMFAQNRIDNEFFS